MRKTEVRLATLLALAFSVAGGAYASSIDVLVGDKDGFGFSTPCSDSGMCADLNSPPIDNRSSAEASATNGAQITDVYSAIFPGNGPNTASTADILLPFSGTLSSATLSFAGGDIQSDVFGAFTADINGVSTPFFFADGRFVTAIHSITLTGSELAAANLAGQVDLHLDRAGSGDFVAFDWFELVGTTGVPEPSTATLFLLGGGLVALARMRRRGTR